MTNRGAETITLIGALVSGDFQLVGNTCGSSLAPRGKCVYLVVFTPSSSGKRTGALTILNHGSGGNRIVHLSGTGK